MGDGRGREGKRAPQAEGPYWAARRGTVRGAVGGSGGGSGAGVAGYSRELLRGALIYAGRGIPVFPCEAGGKRPLTADGFLEATTDEARIRGWWGRWPNANVAIPTGKLSGLLVLDVDAGKGTDSVALLELSRGQSPKTARAATGGGGMHLYFRYVRRIIRRWIPLLRGGRFGRTVKDNQGKETIEPKTFGSTAYLTAKARGDNSMPIKRETPEGVYGVVPRDPRDTVRA